MLRMHCSLDQTNFLSFFIRSYVVLFLKLHCVLHYCGIFKILMDLVKKCILKLIDSFKDIHKSTVNTTLYFFRSSLPY